MNFSEVYKNINGCEPSADDVLRFERLIQELQTTPNDSLLTVLMAFDHFHLKIEKSSRSFTNEINTSLEVAKCDADRIFRSSVESWKAELAKAHTLAAEETSKAIADTAATITKNHSKIKLNQTIMGCVFLTILGLFTAVGGGFYIGREEGLQEAYKINGWLQTPDGKMAFKLFESGELDALGTCSKPGWEKTKDGLCIPKPSKKGLYGWRLK